MMLTQEQIESFHREGYLLVPNVLSTEQVDKLRQFFTTKFEQRPSKRYGDIVGVQFDVYNRYPELRWLLLHQPTIAIAKALLGDDFVVIRESSAHNNGFVGWHKDTTSQEEDGQDFHWADDFLMVEIAYYLQDNSEEYGGGLDVVPGSHLTPDIFLRETSRRRKKWSRTLPYRAWQSLRRRIGLRPKTKQHTFENAISLPIKAGDLLIFHLRLSHRATQPRQLDAAKTKQKLAIFLIGSRNNSHAEKYHKFIYTRPDYVYLKDFSYDPELVEEARRAGLNLL